MGICGVGRRDWNAFTSDYTPEYVSSLAQDMIQALACEAFIVQQNPHRGSTSTIPSFHLRA